MKTVRYFKCARLAVLGGSTSARNDEYCEQYAIKQAIDLSADGKRCKSPRAGQTIAEHCRCQHGS